MANHRIKLSALITLVLLAALFGSLGSWLRAARHQYALNRALIAALTEHDDRRAIALLDAGADPNTRYKQTPVPSLPELLKQVFHRSIPPANDSPTPLLFACGAAWNETGQPEPWSHGPTYKPQLMQALLAHGADVNMPGPFGITPLVQAINNDAGAVRPIYPPGPYIVPQYEPDRNVRLLIKHGANVNMKLWGGYTPLIFASSNVTDPETVLLLLAHGADVNAQDPNGDTALHRAMYSHVIFYGKEASIKILVGDLLAHGANPNVRNKQGDSPLKLAQHHRFFGVAALLRHYGAKP